MVLCERLSEIQEAYSENIEKARETAIVNWIGSISSDEYQKINKTAFNNTIGHKKFVLLGKRKELIVQFVRDIGIQYPHTWAMS
ncbi:MAG: hypothetical protein QY317_03075 [Candidatus Jettenia caeni]|nr:MAG: hypothetical protein QY317_03075 [Candidatus Jettenia caeni]